MSADNWRICPNCKRAAEVAQQKKQDKAAEAYGKVFAEEYLRLLDDANKTTKLTETLREDFEIRTGADGCFGVDYYASCHVCGFKFEFKHSEQVNMGEANVW